MSVDKEIDEKNVRKQIEIHEQNVIIKVTIYRIRFKQNNLDCCELALQVFLNTADWWLKL